MPGNQDACGIPGVGPIPGDPDLTVTLTATARDAGIDVAWSYPALLSQNVAHVTLYKSTASTFNAGVEAAGFIVTGSRYFDQVPLVANSTHYYWVRMTSVAGTVGNLIGPASATMLPTHQWIVDTLVGQIQESQLTALLRTRINSIDNVAADLLTEGIARLAQDSVFSGLLTQQIADLAATDTLVANEVVQRTGQNSALAAQMTAVIATAAGNTAAVITEASARATADSAEAIARQALGVTLNNSVAAAITAERVVRVTAEDALATDITNVSAAFAVGDAAERVVNAAAIEAERLTLANADGAMAISIGTLQVDLGAETGKISTLQTVVGDASSGLVAEYSVRLDVNGHVSGFGLLNTGTSSEFIINADKFAIIKPGYGAAEVPFVIGSVNGATRIVLNAATYIADASIQTLDIGANAVTVPFSSSFGASPSSGGLSNAVSTSISTTLAVNFGSNAPGKVICLASCQVGNVGGYGSQWAAAYFELRYNTSNSTLISGSTLVAGASTHGMKGAPPSMQAQVTLSGWTGIRYFFLTLRASGDGQSAAGWWRSNNSNISILGARR